jgi:tRNA pseudouridine55 synthase
VTFGAQTNTDDLEGEVTHTSGQRPSRDEILAVLPAYIGEIEQVPPAFSAIKINGERAYNLARDGEAVEIAPRTVVIHRLDLLEMPDENTAVFECECGKGTYVRAIARDIGRQLGCFGHITQLRRTAVGPFTPDDLVPLDELVALEGDLDALDAEIIPTGAALEELPEIRITPDQAQRIRSGNSVLLRGRDAPTHADEAFATQGSELVAIGFVEKGEFHPSRVFTASRI